MRWYRCEWWEMRLGFRYLYFCESEPGVDTEARVLIWRMGIGWQVAIDNQQKGLWNSCYLRDERSPVDVVSEYTNLALIYVALYCPCVVHRCSTLLGLNLGILKLCRSFESEASFSWRGWTLPPRTLPLSFSLTRLDLVLIILLFEKFSTVPDVTNNNFRSSTTMRWKYLLPS